MSDLTLDDLRVADDESVYYCHSDDNGDVYHDTPPRRLTPAEFDRIARERGYVKLLDGEGLFAKPICDALERFLRLRGVYPTKGGRVFPGDKVVGSEDVLEVILEVAIDQEAT